MALRTQGTLVYVSTGKTGNQVISGITKAAQAVVTATGHTYVVGDVVNITGVTGMTTVNGDWLVVAAATNTFTIDYDSRKADTYVSGGVGAKVNFVSGCGITSGSGFDGSADEIETTTLCSTAKEFITGLQDFGNVTFEVNWNVDSADAWQAAMRAALAEGTPRVFKITLPDDVGMMKFSGFVKSAPRSFSTGDKWGGSYEVRITGRLTDLEL